MLNYYHSCHAGNHADVLKHTVQSLIIELLKEKEEPFLCLDTHTGTDRYQLSSEHAKHVSEYLERTAYVWQQDSLLVELEPYIDMVQRLNRSGQSRCYPGSPLITRQLLREQDSLQLAGLHPNDLPLLRSKFQKDKRTHVAKVDGCQQLKAELLPVSRHGLILIDPSHEVKSSCQAVVISINEGYKRFVTDAYALWCLVVLCQQTKRMIHDLEDTNTRRILQIELAMRPDSDQHDMTASGMIVINPPWELEQ